MPYASDSNYAAVTRHRRPFSTTGRPPVLEIVDDDWAASTLADDDIPTSRHEAALAPLLEEFEMDAADAMAVSPAGNSSMAANNNASERRRREEGWTDLGLDQLDPRALIAAAGPQQPTTTQPSGGNTG